MFKAKDAGFFLNIKYTVLYKQVLEIMARNLVRIARCLNHHGRDRTQMLRFAIGLHLAISPDDAEMQLIQVRLFLHLNINLKDVCSHFWLYICLVNNRPKVHNN